MRGKVALAPLPGRARGAGGIGSTGGAHSASPAGPVTPTSRWPSPVTSRPSPPSGLSPWARRLATRQALYRDPEAARERPAMPQLEALALAALSAPGDAVLSPALGDGAAEFSAALVWPSRWSGRSPTPAPGSAYFFSRRSDTSPVTPPIGGGPSCAWRRPSWRWARLTVYPGVWVLWLSLQQRIPIFGASRAFAGPELRVPGDRLAVLERRADDGRLHARLRGPRGRAGRGGRARHPHARAPGRRVALSLLLLAWA